MANYDIAHKRDAIEEGAYSNDPNDKGGETVLGKAINYDTPGRFPLFWKRVKELKDLARGDLKRLEMLILGDAELHVQDRLIDKAKYWDIMQLDGCPSQEVANCLHTIALNVGETSAITYLQKALNKLNRGGTSWPDMAVDGQFGPSTLKALDACLAVPLTALNLFKLLGAQQSSFYLDRSSEDFENGLVSKRVFHLGDYASLCKRAGIVMAMLLLVVGLSAASTATPTPTKKSALIARTTPTEAEKVQPIRDNKGTLYQVGQTVVFRKRATSKAVQGKTGTIVRLDWDWDLVVVSVDGVEVPIDNMTALNVIEVVP